jgi:hypothetical protein
MKPYIETLRNVIIGSTPHKKGAILEIGVDITIDEARSVLTQPELARQLSERPIATPSTPEDPSKQPAGESDSTEPVRPFNRKAIKTWKRPGKRATE